MRTQFRLPNLLVQAALLLLASTLLPVGPRASAQTTNCISPPDGLVSWWRTEGDFTDTVGANNGVSAGDVTFTAGEVGQAFGFDGTTNSYVQVPDAPALLLTNELTIEFWVKRLRLDYPSLPYAEYIVEKGGDWTGNQVNYAAALHNVTANYCLHFVFAGGWRGGGSIADTNFWHHCAIVARNGDANPTLYIDGVSQPIAYSEGASTINLYPSDLPLHIGALLDPATGYFYYSDTLVDELAIYDRELSAAEIQAIYNAGSAGKCTPLPLPPTIGSQPVSQTVNVGDTATFSVIAQGSNPLAYQWFFGNSAVSGGTSSSLTLANVQPEQAGLYSAVVSNSYGSATSSNALLTVLSYPPAILHQPQSTNIYVGASLALQVSASGSPVLSYQWQKDGAPLAGGTASIYRLLNVQVTNSGTYSVVVTNPFGSVTSSDAVVTVLVPPPCVPPPAGLISWWRAETNSLDGWDSNNGFAAPSGVASYGPGKVGRAFLNSSILVPDSLSLRPTNAITIQAWVNAPSYSGTHTILSKFDYPLQQIPGTQSSYFLGTTNNGQLYFVVSPGGSPRTNAFVIAPEPLPTNAWSFVVASYDGTALRLYINGSLAASRAYSGGIFSGSDDLGIGAIMPGSGYGLLWPFSGSIDEVCLYNRALTDGEIESIYNADLTGMCLEPPVLVTQPQSQAIPEGEDVKFSVSVLGSRPLRYQWYFNGNRLQTATGANLVLEKVHTNQVGSYSVLVTNSLGSVLSSNAALTLLPAPVCSTAPLGAISWWPADGSPIDVVGTNHARNSTLQVPPYVVGKVGLAFNLTSSSQLRNSVTVPNSPSLNFGSNADFSIEAWVKYVQGPVVIGPPPVYPIASNDMEIVGKRGVSFPLTPSSSYSLSLKQGRLAFSFVWAVGRITNSGTFIANGADLRDGMFHHVALALHRNAADGGNLFVDGERVLTFDATRVTGSLSNNGSLFIGSDGAFSGLIDELAIYSRALSADEILAIHDAGAAGKCKVAPFITQQPADQVAPLHGTAQFSIGAGGTGTLRYQWIFSRGTIPGAIPGATASTLVLSNLQLANSGLYSVRVTNGFGSTLSTNAHLLVNQAPVALCRSVVVPAGPNCMADASVDAGSSDPDGDAITVTQAPPGPYPLGTNLVTLTATDVWGASNSCNALVVVLDQTPPMLVCPANIVTTNDLNQCGAVVTFPLPTASDLCSAVTNISCVPAPGSLFPVGATVVQCAATDAAGNTGTCSFTVTVRDTQPPTINCPADIVVTNAHNAWTSVVTFSPTDSDNCPGVSPPTSEPPSGSLFSLGTNLVTCTAIDVAGNSNQCTFRVIVRSGNQPPVPIIDVSPLAHFPGRTNLIVIAPRGTNTTVVFDGSRSYDVDDTNFYYYWYEGTNQFSTNVVARRVLGLGRHQITLRVDDTFPLGTNSTSVTVRVISLAGAVDIVEDMVEDANLPRRIEEKLLDSLDAAERDFERGHLRAGYEELRGFRREVERLVRPINDSLADRLEQAVQQILNALDRLAAGTGSPARPIHLIRQANGRTRVQFTGQPGGVQIVEASSNLVDWQPIGVAGERTTGSFEFEDTRAANLPTRFYRVTSPDLGGSGE